jgi:hypothetical protein
MASAGFLGPASVAALGLPDSDFSTLVLPCRSPYNPFKKQGYLRSQEDVRVENTGALPGERHKTQWIQSMHWRSVSSG